MSRSHGRLSALIFLTLVFGNCGDEEEPAVDGGGGRAGSTTPDTGPADTGSGGSGPDASRDGPAPDSAADKPVDGPTPDTLGPEARPDNCGTPGKPCCGKDNTCFDGACCA